MFIKEYAKCYLDYSSEINVSLEYPGGYIPIAKVWGQWCLDYISLL